MDRRFDTDKKQMSMRDETQLYYDERAPFYDITAGYEDPDAERLRGPAKARYQDLFREEKVLEVACGTGYWTAVIGEVARSVLAIDINQSVIDIAKDRCGYLNNVAFKVADACSMKGIPHGFTAAMGIWWWSHIRKSCIPDFLQALHDRLKPGSLVLFRDQLPYEGCLRKQDPGGNTLELRTLPDGRTFWVAKNFPEEEELREYLEDMAEDIQYIQYNDEKHWELCYRTKQNTDGKGGNETQKT